MQPESVRSSDEISLVDVIRVLRKQQKIVYLTVFFALLVGIAIAWFRPQTVVFRQAFSLGSYITNGQVSYLGSPSMLASKLKTIYLPQFIKEYNEKHPANRLMAQGSSIELVASLELPSQIDKNKEYLLPEAGILYLSMMASPQQKQFFEELRSFVLQSLIAEQTPLMVSLQTELKQKIEILNQELPELKRFNEFMQESIMKKHGVERAQSLTSTNYLADIALQNKSSQYIDLVIHLNSLQNQLSSLTPSVFLGGSFTIPQKKTSNALLIVLSLMLGLMLGVLLAFFVNITQSLKTNDGKKE